MVKRTSNKGKVIDFDSLIAQNQDEPAMGNMKVNAKGDVIGRNGEIVQKAEDRVRAYYEDNPNASTAKTSLKGTYVRSTSKNKGHGPEENSRSTKD